MNAKAPPDYIYHDTLHDSDDTLVRSDWLTHSPPFIKRALNHSQVAKH